MKQFLKKLMLGVATLAMFCCMVPLASAADPTYYTIYLEPQGGIGVATQIYAYGSNGSYRAANLPAPTMEGYTFDGWYDDIVGGNKVTTKYEFGSDGQTIYAHWTVAPKSSSSTSTSKPTDSTQTEDGSFKLSDHLGTLLVVGTTVLVVTLVAMHG